jgi:hypothetical protein
MQAGQQIKAPLALARQWTISNQLIAINKSGN